MASKKAVVDKRRKNVGHALLAMFRSQGFKFRFRTIFSSRKSEDKPSELAI
jgi:hypothetical protein